MLLTMPTITMEEWKLGGDIDFRVRPNKNFQPKNVDNIYTPQNAEVWACTLATNPDGSSYLIVPEIQLHTTTDADLGDNVRYIAEFWDRKKKQRVASFPVNNFKLDPSMSVGSNGELVEPEWASVAAWNRTYKRSNRSGLNIDLSDYPTRNEVIELIQDAIDELEAAGYTRDEINTIITNLTNNLTELINNIQLDENYYTKPQVDTLLNTLIYNIFNGAQDEITAYTQEEIDDRFADYWTSAQISLLFYNTFQVDDKFYELDTALNTRFALYYTAAQTVSLLTSALTNYYTEAEIDTMLAGLLEDYYTKEEVDALFDEQKLFNITETLVALQTASIDQNELYYHTVSLGKTALITEFVSDTPVRIRVYQTAAERLADAARAVSSTEPPPAGIGLVAEVVLTASKLTQRMSPAANFVNADSTRASQMYLTIQKQTEGAAVVQINIKAIKVER